MGAAAASLSGRSSLVDRPLADLLIGDDALDLHQGAIRGAPQQPVGIAGADELDIAIS